ncbi:MAG: hypothetical protein Q4G24_15375 [Paracoccus sp. (in: a-proteobacteria)]|uniref:hypothetical protein n=1 Tax=Paracoccus sp. TaxID=267 RepID=UPI0026DF16A4|nr:hypothetical protein [Paracoccus sp. (in: a-proteobacteria)]MDO5622829.1 hypothetical protein [Paracoccus sp. (in: a-proteobacteria)]
MIDFELTKVDMAMKTVLFGATALATAAAALAFAQFADRPTNIPAEAALIRPAVERVAPNTQPAPPVAPLLAEPAPQTQPAPDIPDVPVPTAAAAAKPTAANPAANPAAPELLAAFPRMNRNADNSLGLLPYAAAPDPVPQQTGLSQQPDFYNLPMIGVYR